MVNNTELLENVEKAILAILARWGSRNNTGNGRELYTPDHKVWALSHNAACGIEERGINGRKVILHDNICQGDPLAADSMLASVVTYLASEDFTRKVAGSIRRLKAIVKAVGDE